MDAKTQIIIGAAGLTIMGLVTASIIATGIKNKKLCDPLPGTTKTERLYIDKKSKK